jgi:hypothetical protein
MFLPGYGPMAIASIGEVVEMGVLISTIETTAYGV